MTDSNLPAPSQKASAPRTVMVTHELQAAVIRDMRRYIFTRWAFIVIAVALPIFAVYMGVMASHGDIRALVYAVGLALAPIGMFLALARLVKSGVVLAYPVAGQATTRIDDTGLSVTASATTTDMSFDSITRVRDAPSSIILERGKSGARPVPRALLSEDDIARLRAAVASIRK